MKASVIKYVAIDQHGEMVSIWRHPAAELSDQYNGRPVVIRYDDDGTPCGYTLTDDLGRRRVFTLYTLKRWGMVQ